MDLISITSFFFCFLLQSRWSISVHSDWSQLLLRHVLFVFLFAPAFDMRYQDANPESSTSLSLTLFFQHYLRLCPSSTPLSLQHSSPSVSLCLLHFSILPFAQFPIITSPPHTRFQFSSLRIAFIFSLFGLSFCSSPVLPDHVTISSSHHTR